MHVMIDIETMGLRPGSVIAAIGLVHFDPGQGKILGEKYIPIDMVDCERYWLTMDVDTVLWWLKQSDTARAEIHSPVERRLLLAEALGTILATFEIWTEQWRTAHPGQEPNLRIWANGPSFDLVLLEAAFAKIPTAMNVPWKFWQHRDVRTIIDLAGDGVKQQRAEIEHHALHDARAQAWWVINGYARLRLSVLDKPLETIPMSEDVVAKLSQEWPQHIKSIQAHDGGLAAVPVYREVDRDVAEVFGTELPSAPEPVAAPPATEWGYYLDDGETFIAVPKQPIIMGGYAKPPVDVTLPSGRVVHVIEREISR